MQRIIIITLLLTLYGFGTPQSASAIFCSNCSQVALQVPQFAKEIINTGANVLSQINTYAPYLKIITDPIQNALIVVTILKQQSNTLNLVTGALGGQALLQSNPEQWIKNQGLNSVRINLNDITASNGIYSGSLLNNLVTTYRAGSNITTQLQSLSNSSVPTLVQNNLCKDANLTAVAKNDVMKSDGTFDPGELSKRKTELYTKLCTGNPASNLALGRQLNEINKQRPDIGGWDTWLATVNGDNEYAKSVQASLVVAADKEAKEAGAKDDLNRGGGIVSPSVCKDAAAENDALGLAGVANLPCRMRELTNSSGAVSSAFQQAINAPLERLTNSFGGGILGSLSSLLATAATIKNAFGGLNIGGGSGGGSNISRITAASSTPDQDLAGKPDDKKALVDPMVSRIDTYASHLDALEQAGNNLLMEVAIAENAATTIKNCFQKLIDDFSIATTSSEVQEGFSYRDSKLASLAAFRATVVQDKVAISEARTFVTETKTKIETSSSSEEIGALYNAFEAKITNKSIPSDSAHFERDSSYQSLKGDNQLDALDSGIVFRLNGQCTETRQRRTPREGA